MEALGQIPPALRVNKNKITRHAFRESKPVWGVEQKPTSPPLPPCSLSTLIWEPSCPFPVFNGHKLLENVTCSFYHPVFSEWWGKVCAGESLSGWSGLGRVKARQYSHHCGLSSKGAGLQLISSPVLSQLFSFNILCFFKMWGLVSSNVVTSYICLWFKKHGHSGGSGV